MELNTLIAECTAYDFKVMLEEKKPKSWLKSVSAFANGLGGSLFFGIDNEGIVKGLDDVQHVCETPTITGKQMSETLSVSQRTIERNLSIFEENGSSETSRQG